jgi:hypothetical protein
MWLPINIRMSNTYKGYFKPKNPSKYKGDPSDIIYRSRWELVFMRYCDKHPDILQWSSEELIIPYKSPIDGRWHRYFPDFWIKKKNREGKIDITVVEIKPYAQTKEPSVQKRLTKKYLYEVKTWGVNKSKWIAADKYCKERGWQFMIMTEHELGIK